jgi:Domain of unknown function (DUF4440)
MRVPIAIAAALASTAPGLAAAKPPSSLEAHLIALEKQSWEAWQKKDVPFWQRHLSGDHVEIDGPVGPQDRNYVIKGVGERSCSVDNYKVDNFQFRALGRDAGMLVYHAEQQFTCGDKHFPNVGWVTSLYRRKNGAWENVLFEHYPVPPKPATTSTP